MASWASDQTGCHFLFLWCPLLSGWGLGGAGALRWLVPGSGWLGPAVPFGFPFPGVGCVLSVGFVVVFLLLPSFVVVRFLHHMLAACRMLLLS